jgi:flagellar motility protein MotE (MotC chaperone)
LTLGDGSAPTLCNIALQYAIRQKDRQLSADVKSTIFYKSVQLGGYADDMNIMGRMKRAVSEVYRQLKDRAKEVQRQLKERAKEVYRQLKDRAKEVYRQLKDRAKEVYRQLKERAKEVYRQLKERAKEVGLNIRVEKT